MSKNKKQDNREIKKTKNDKESTETPQESVGNSSDFVGPVKKD